MKITTDLEEANKLLSAYKGATFKVTMFSQSLKRLAMKLTLPNNDRILYLVGVSCESMKGGFYFKNAQLSIITKVDEITNEEMTIITDKASEFELITSGGFSLAQGIEEEFGNSFDDFLKDKN